MALNPADASFELAACIQEYIKSSSLYLGWTISDEPTPGHLLKYKGKAHFVICPKIVLQVYPNDEYNKYVATSLSSMLYPFDETLSSYDPQFFSKLAVKMLDISGRDIDPLTQIRWMK